MVQFRVPCCFCSNSWTFAPGSGSCRAPFAHRRCEQLVAHTLFSLPFQVVLFPAMSRNVRFPPHAVSNLLLVLCSVGHFVWCCFQQCQEACRSQLTLSADQTQQVPDSRAKGKKNNISPPVLVSGGKKHERIRNNVGQGGRGVDFSKETSRSRGNSRDVSLLFGCSHGRFDPAQGVPVEFAIRRP